MGKAIIRVRVKGTALWGESLEGNASFPDPDQESWAADYELLSTTWGTGPEWYSTEHEAEFIGSLDGDIVPEWVRSIYLDTYGTGGMCYLWHYNGADGSVHGEELRKSHMLMSSIFELLEILSITPLTEE